jgi:hypothetical protein
MQVLNTSRTLSLTHQQLPVTAQARQVPTNLYGWEPVWVLINVNLSKHHAAHQHPIHLLQNLQLLKRKSVGINVADLGNKLKTLAEISRTAHKLGHLQCA